VWNRREPGNARKPVGALVVGQIAVDSGNELGVQQRSEAGHALDRWRVGMSAESLGDGLLDLVEFGIQSRELMRESFDGRVACPFTG